MTRRCQVTGAGPGIGNRVSHSHRRTRRRWDVNLQPKRYWVPSQSRRIRLRLTPRAISMIDRDGIDAVIARMSAADRRSR